MIHMHREQLSKAKSPKRGQTRCFLGPKGLGGDWQLRWPRKDGSRLEFGKIMGLFEVEGILFVIR